MESSLKLDNVAVAPVAVAADCARPAKRPRQDEKPLPTILQVPDYIAAWRQRLFVPTTDGAGRNAEGDDDVAWWEGEERGLQRDEGEPTVR